LRDDFAAFAKNNANVVALVEDWELKDFKNQEEALEQKGERGLIMYWAKNLNVKVIPTDFDHNTCKHIKVLATEFQYEDIVLFIFLYRVKSQTLDKWIEKENLEEYLVEKVNSNLECASLPKTTFDELQKLHIAKFDQTIQERSHVKAWEDLSVKKPDNGVNTIFKAFHTLRDRNFLYQIVANYEQGKNVYVIYGCDHAQFHRPILDKLFNQTQ